jgi:4-amino-4-deoxy-L-arabinose transferase-like glycosyltransferase
VRVPRIASRIQVRRRTRCLDCSGTDDETTTTRITLVSLLSTLKKHRAFFILIAMAATLFLSDIWLYTEFVRAESYFALGARSMVERHEWLTPHAPDELQLNKPPLTYWLIGVSYKLFGASYGTARLPSVLAALLILAIVYGLGSWLHGIRAGLISAAMLASSYLFLSFARMAMSDMLLTLWVTTALTCFLVALVGRTRRSQSLVFVAYVALALGVLTKGPVALALVAVPIALDLLARRDRASVKRLRLVSGLGVLLLVAAPYFLLVYVRAGFSPLRFFFLSENLQRFTGQVYESGSRPFWYEIVAFFSDFAPWSGLIFLAGWFDWQRWREGTSSEAKRILYFSLLWVVALFTLASFKRDYYLLPAMPAAALIIGPLLASAEGLAVIARRLLAAFVILCSAFTVMVALLSLRAAAVLSIQTSFRFLPLALAILGAAAVVIWVARGKTWQAALILLTTIWATILSLQLSLLPAFVRYLPTAQLATKVPAGRVIYSSWSASDWASGLEFGLASPNSVERLIGDLDDQRLTSVLNGNSLAVAIVWEREYLKLVERDPGLKILAEAETYSHGGLSSSLIRNPQRQRLLLVGH